MFTCHWKLPLTSSHSTETSEEKNILNDQWGNQEKRAMPDLCLVRPQRESFWSHCPLVRGAGCTPCTHERSGSATNTTAIFLRAKSARGADVSHDGRPENAACLSIVLYEDKPCLRILTHLLQSVNGTLWAIKLNIVGDNIEGDVHCWTLCLQMFNRYFSLDGCCQKNNSGRRLF